MKTTSAAETIRCIALEDAARLGDFTHYNLVIARVAANKAGLKGLARMYNDKALAVDSLRRAIRMLKKGTDVKGELEKTVMP